MTSTPGARVDPVPLFDLVTGFPPDDALDVTLPVPLSLAVYMTMLESTGRAAELAVLRRIHIEQAREATRGLQASVGEVTGGGADARLRITHIVEQRVPRVNGLRPHLHAYVGATVRSPGGGPEVPVDVEALAALAASVLRTHRDRLAAATTERVGLTWGATSWSPCELVEPRWLVDSTERMRHDELSCPGPWPRHQVVGGPPSRPTPLGTAVPP